MNYKLFLSLHNNLISLLDQSEELFDVERTYLQDWLRKEQLSEKYKNTDIKELIEQNKYAVEHIIYSLQSLLNPSHDYTNQIALEIFGTNEN